MTDLFSGASTQITPFSFNSHAVRVIQRDGQPWFVAADVCGALELANVTMALRRLDADEQALISIEGISRGNDQASIINESGLYSLILSSRKPEAKRFKKWVTSEVLPAIRKTGSYGQQDQERLQLAFSLSTEVAAQASRTVFDAVMAGDDGWKHDRWMFCLNDDSNYKPSIPWAKAIDRKANVMSLESLAKAIVEPGGMLPTNTELANLAAACNKRLAERLEYQASKKVVTV